MRIIEGNVLQVPLPDASYDVVVSQEALLHVPDKQRTFLEAFIGRVESAGKMKAPVVAEAFKKRPTDSV